MGQIELSKRLIEHALGCSEPDFTQCQKFRQMCEAGPYA
jgi:hypothetical protein